MSDLTESRVCGVYVYLTGSFSIYAAYTDHTEDVDYDSITYISATTVDFSALASHSIDMTSEECEVGNLPILSNTLLQNIKLRYPYKNIGLKIFSFELDDSGVVVGTPWTLWKGLVYSSKYQVSKDTISLTSRNDKYYADRVAGIRCMEQCSVAYFGDAICQATTHSESVTINSISGNNVGFSSAPSGVDHLYRRGYLEYEGLEIAIEEWRSTPGTTALMTEQVPSAWFGKTVTIHSGCDRTYDTCENIHNNTEHMLPLGINMVDYNTYMEFE